MCRARFISAEESTGVTFDDFAGQEYVKRELQEVVKILKDAKEFEDLGIYCPKGVLLYGPPGTGKHYLPRRLQEKLVFLSSLLVVLSLWRYYFWFLLLLNYCSDYGSDIGVNRDFLSFCI